MEGPGNCGITHSQSIFSLYLSFIIFPVRPYPVSFKFDDIPESVEPGGACPGGRAGRLGLELDRIAGGAASQEERAGIGRRGICAAGDGREG